MVIPSTTLPSWKRLSFWQMVVLLHETTLWEQWPGHNFLGFAGEEREKKCCGHSSAPLPNAGSVRYIKYVNCLEKCQNRQMYLLKSITELRPCAVCGYLEELIRQGWALGAGLPPFQQQLGKRHWKSLAARVLSTCSVWELWQLPLPRCCSCCQRPTPAQSKLVLGTWAFGGLGACSAVCPFISHRATGTALLAADLWNHGISLLSSEELDMWIVLLKAPKPSRLKLGD